MDKQIKNYIFYEASESCRSEFLMKDGRFYYTEDAVVIGIASGENARDALRNLNKECPYLRKYKFDNLVAQEVGEAIYL